MLRRVWYSTLSGVLGFGTQEQGKLNFDKEESLPTKDGATAGTRAARVPQPETAFDATQQGD